MVGRDVLFRVEKERRARPARRCSRSTRLDVARRPRAARGARRVARGPRAARSSAIAGVDGNGQSELIEAITGLRAPAAGQVRVGGRDITGAGVRGALRRRRRPHRRGPPPPRPRARLHAGREPRAARVPPRAARRFGLLSPQADARASAAPLLARVRRARRRARHAGRSLSGGNQQKVVIAREIAEEPQVLVAAQPTRGLDVGAIEFVHRRLLEQRDAGRAVLLVSLELDEIRSLADRILVIYDGPDRRRAAADASDEELGVAMTGGQVSGVTLTGSAATRAARRRSPSPSRLLGLPARRRDHRPARHRAPRVPRRRHRGRARRARTRSTPTRRSSRARA